MPAKQAADRVQELMDRKAELEDTLRKVVPIRPPPYLYTTANIERFQESLKEMFLSGDNSMTRNYLRFLVEGITITDEQIDISARTDAALRLMAGGSRQEKTESVNPSVVSPTMGLDWLPNGTCSGRILSGFVIDIGEARKRLRPNELDESRVPPVVEALALADEFQRLLDTGAVKRRANLARRFKLSRARVTQLLDLHKLHPAIQHFVRNLSGVGPRYLSVRTLRLLCPLPHEQQLAELRSLCAKFAGTLAHGTKTVGVTSVA